MDPVRDPLFVPFQVFQAEGDVLIHRHVGPQGVILEQEAHVALVGGQVDAPVRVKDHIAVDADGALRGGLQARDHAQGGGFAAAGGAQQCNEGIAFDIQVQIIHGNELAKALGYVFQNDFRHISHPLPYR